MNILMTLIQSWRLSLTAWFQPGFAKLFFFALVRGLREVYTCFYTTAAWWLIPFLGASLYILSDGPVPLITNFFIFILYLFAFFILICSARSSVSKKNWQYVKEKIINFFPGYFLFCGFFIIILYFIIAFVPLLQSMTTILPAHALTIMLLFGFWWVDSRPTVFNFFKAIRTTFHMFFFNYPFFLIPLIFYWASMKMCAWMLSFICFTILNPLVCWLICAPLYIVLLSNIYIRLLYEQNEKYFTK